MKLEGRIKAIDATMLHLMARDNTTEGFLARMILELNIEISRLKDIKKTPARSQGRERS